jgi:hypothetical protein
MEEIITDLKGNRFRMQFDFLSPQQVSAVKSVLMKSEITPALVASLVSAIQQAAPEQAGCHSCGCGASAVVGAGGGIRTLNPATCPGPKIVGQTTTLTSTPTGGTPGTAGYTVTFRRNGVDLSGGTFTGVPEGSPRTLIYTHVAADVPSVPLSVYITDNCPSGAKNNTDQCVVTVSACNVPACGFVVT